MLLKQIFNSLSVWHKLTTITIQPLIAYKILKYIKLVNAEYGIIEEQRKTLAYKITNTKENEPVQIKKDTPEFAEFMKGHDEILAVESTLEKLDITFEEMLIAIMENSTLTVQDLAVLEPFFVE